MKIGYWRNRIFFEVDNHYPEELHELHSELPHLLERMKIRKVGKLVTNLYSKKMLYT